MSDDGGCGCFLFLIVLPVVLVALYIVWRWALTFMGVL